MPKKRKSGGEEEFTPSGEINTKGSEIYEKGGRVLRVRETCMCPVCGVYFSPTEIQTHAQAYFLEQAEIKKKPKKLSSSSSFVTPTQSPIKDNTLSKSDSSISSPEKKSPITPPRPRVVTPKWKPNTVVGWNIPYAPVFRPTEAEFKKPLEYISKIRPIAEKYHYTQLIHRPPYRINHPESWDEQIGDPNTLNFRTKIQNIHQLKTRWQGRNEVFVSNLASFLEKRGEPLRIIPRVDGRDLDLFKLFTSVVNRGGYQVVERANLWKSVADELKLSTVCVRNNTLRNHYHKYLYDYELYRKSKLQFRPASTPTPTPVPDNKNNNVDDDLYIAEDITGDLYNTDYMEEDDMEDEFGFYEGEEYTLAKFEKKAKNFSEKWFPSRPTPEQVEEEFWRIVETAEDSVKVDYGSDLDVTKLQRSGFPRDREDGTYLTLPSTHWNLNRLPRMRGSVLSHIKETVAGVTDPMLYVGMLFSSFCWHTEDNYLYSINYMHKGTAKTWYGVPAGAAEHFERVMKDAVPDLFLKHPDLLHLLITMVSPAVLAENKVPIYHAVQEPGQYVITFPKAYHAGFSHGFTCAEAVNFAPADWLPYGYESVQHYRELKRPSVFSHEQLMVTIASQADLSAESAFWLGSELMKVREKEQTARDILRLAGFAVQIASPSDSRDEPKQCKVCNYDCYLSSVSCSCSPQYVGCLYHYNEFCESCSPRSKVLKVLVPLNELDALIETTKKIMQQAPAKAVIDLTDEEESHISMPSTAYLNNITTLPLTPLPPSPSTSRPPVPPSRSPIAKEAAQKIMQIAQETQKGAAQETQKPAESTQRSATQETHKSATQGTHKNAESSHKGTQAAQEPSSPAGSPSGVDSPTSKASKGIVINLNKKDKPSPYDNKIPPPPNISRPATTANLNVSSLTLNASKSSPSPSFSPLPSNKPYLGKEPASSPSPTFSDQMQGMAIAGYSKNKPVVVVDSPTKV